MTARPAFGRLAQPARLAAGAVVAAVALVPALALARLGAASDTSVAFTAVGPGGLKIEGTTNELQVTEDPSAVVHVVVPLAKLDTGMSLRNKHMREKYLQVDKFPNAELTVPRASIAFPAPGQGTKGQAAGTLTLHGVSKPVTVAYDAKHDGNLFRVNGTMHVNMKDYGIDVPSYLGVTVKPDVDVTVKYTVTDG